MAGSLEPIPVMAIVFYNDTLPGYSLVVVITDAENTPQTIVPGIITTSTDPCANQPVLAALCVVKLSAASGAEQVNFQIGGILGAKRGPGTWDLNITTALLDSSNTLVPKSTSTILFKILLVPVALRVIVPAAVTVSVDGVQQPAGPAEVAVELGEHNLTAPSLVKIDTTTRLKFDHWSDGVTETNRTILITSDTNIEAVYMTQNLLTITGPQLNVTGAGWYDENAIATFTVPQTQPMSGIMGALGGKLNFQGWYENGQLLTASITGTISMNQPHTVTAVWQTDYSVPGVILVGIAVIVAIAYVTASRRIAKPTKRSSRRRRKRSR